MSSRNEDLAWAAGFFDGEGCTHIHKIYRGTIITSVTLIFSVAQTELEPLAKLQRIVGLGKVSGPYKTSKGRPAYSYKLYQTDTPKAMEMLWPWLSEIKKEQYRQTIREFRRLDETRERYSNSKLKISAREDILRSNEPYLVLAKRHNCSVSAVQRIRKLEKDKTYPNA